ncbi:MAG: CDP-alcohol phosphatidyltransferase family protein [Ignavibacteriae bacterium]|nr:CDP-alcohol phosphatidyltransferase family protein [Ignavibacteriota bacterium]
MSLYNEYKSSLKSFDVEEILDLLIYRPISFLFVKLIYPTNLTPNQISIISMIFGLGSGVLFYFGEYFYIIAGGIFIFISNVLDCADGQLARLKKNGTKVGRIIDGFIDYVTGASIFFGIGFALHHITGNPLYVYNKVNDVNAEIIEFTEEKERLKSIKGKLLDKSLVNMYLFYCNLQINSTKHVELNITPEMYKQKNKSLLRLWSWIGSTTHLTLTIVFCFINRLDIYLIITILLGNFIFLILLIVQKSVIKKLSLN